MVLRKIIIFFRYLPNKIVFVYLKQMSLFNFKTATRLTIIEWQNVYNFYVLYHMFFLYHY